MYSDSNKADIIEAQKLKESLGGVNYDDADDQEKPEPFLKRIFGSKLNLANLTFRQKIQKIIESNFNSFFLELLSNL